MSPTVLLILLAPVTALVVFFTVVIVLRRPIQDAMFPGAGAREWGRVASTLTWRERWQIARSSARGRPAPAPLAHPAVQRGRLATAMIEQMLTRGSRSRRLWLGLGVFWIAMIVFWIVMLVLDPRVSSWFNLALAGYWLALIWYLLGPAQRRVLERIQRSITLNEEQLADGDPLSRR